MIIRFLIAAVVALLNLSLAAAQTPSDEAPSPETEARVEAVAETIRCVVCKNQSIADSDASLAKDMVRVVRERIEAGDSDEEVRAYLVNSYGEFVLMRPTWSAKNIGLWAAPLILLGIGAALAFHFIRTRPNVAAASAPLTDEERAELAQRLGETSASRDQR